MKLLVVCKDKKDSKEVGILKSMMSNCFDTKYSWKNSLKAEDLKAIDLVISIGGDGTALSASHFLVDKPLLAVNSNPKKSEGALTTITLEELDKKLKEIKSGKFKTEKLERIKVFVNDKLQNPLALNEVFIANEKAYLVSKYKIKFNGLEEEQRSSGLIFSTGTGSTAWFKSASGEPFPAQSRFIKMIVREPFIRRLGKFERVREVIEEKDEMEIICLTKMIMAIDSIREIKLEKGDKVKIKISDKPLVRVV